MSVMPLTAFLSIVCRNNTLGILSKVNWTPNVSPVLDNVDRDQTFQADSQQIYL